MTPAIRHVVAATDFSEPAGWAVARAARICAEHRARLTLVHVLNHDWMDALRGWLGSEAGWSQRMLETAQSQLAEEAAGVQQRFGVAVQPQVIDGQPVAAIGQLAHDQQADLLVVGVHGTSPVRHWIIGTTAERLLRLAQLPLLMVRQPPKDGYRLALVPVDFSAWSAAATGWAQAVAPHAQWVLAHTFTVPFEEKLRFAGVDAATIDLYRDKARRAALLQLEALVAAQADVADRYSLCLREGDAAPAMVQEAQDRGCDLVVIGKHGRNAAEELLLGSVTRHLLAEAPCDVMVSTQRADLPPLG